MVCEILNAVAHWVWSLSQLVSVAMAEHWLKTTCVGNIGLLRLTLPSNRSSLRRSGQEPEAQHKRGALLTYLASSGNLSYLLLQSKTTCPRMVLLLHCSLVHKLAFKKNVPTDKPIGPQDRGISSIESQVCQTDSYSYLWQSSKSFHIIRSQCIYCIESL